MSHHPVEDSNPSSNPQFQDILGSRLTRRQTLLGGLSATTTALFSGAMLVGCDDDNSPDDSVPTPTGPKLAFSPVAKSTADRVAVPVGYKAEVLLALGDPIKTGITAYANDGTQGDFDQRIGDHGDALAYYPIGGSSTEGLLTQNHEALTDIYLHEAGPTEDAEGRRPLTEVLKEQHAHGISVVKIKKGTDGKWAPDLAATENTRWHVNSEMELTGPVAGSDLVKTKLSSNGIVTFGTLNNCGHGYTPWGTYISGEENWFAYFKTSTDSPLLGRYGIRSSSTGFNYRGWDTPVDADDLQKRFNCSVTAESATDDFRNEPNHFGYNVEIDPYNPNFKPKKRTALGRFSHEGAWFSVPKVGRPLAVYQGDDANGEYVYKFVTTKNWDAADATKGGAIGGSYLDSGTLYVARFNADGNGEWLPLTVANPALSAFANLAEILVNTRAAADAAGATRMDRPEWGGVNPKTGEFYLTLTNCNTTFRSADKVDAANPRAYTDTKINGAVTKGNANGHIIRLRETGDDAAATTFKWDIYLFGARSTADATNVNLSGLNDDNDFSSPDGLWFDSRGICWIQTDDGRYTDITNCMMLAGTPGSVGDGAKVTVNNSLDGKTKSVETYVGKKPTTETLARFLVGPKDCEITGVDLTPDRKTMFVNIQHPGETGDLTRLTSNWPAATGADASITGGANNRPRTATIVITRVDGGEIGV